MDVSYKDSYKKLEEVFNNARPNGTTYPKAKAALEMKAVADSAKHAQSLTKATWALVGVTAILCLLTLASAIFSYRAYQGSIEQANAMNALSEATKEQANATTELVNAVKYLPGQFKDLQYLDIK